ncbi:MAG: hypothetical protein QW051_01730 [Candidatus Aenigmatarchaeota archaeon]
MNKIVPIIAIFLLVIVSGCISIVEEQPLQKCIEPEKLINNICCFDDNNNGICDIDEKECPKSCEDENPCTKDYLVGCECKHEEIKPCCGNGICEPEEDLANECSKDCIVITMTDFYHASTGPDFMENDTYVFIHTGSVLMDKKAEFYLNITAKNYTLRNIKAIYNCTDVLTKKKIDSINVERVEVVEGHPQFGYENMLKSDDYTIYTHFYTKNKPYSVEVQELQPGNTTQYKVRFVKNNYKTKGNLICDFTFYFFEPLKRVKKTLKLSFI